MGASPSGGSGGQDERSARLPGLSLWRAHQLLSPEPAPQPPSSSCATASGGYSVSPPGPSLSLPWRKGASLTGGRLVTGEAPPAGGGRRPSGSLESDTSSPGLSEWAGPPHPGLKAHSSSGWGLLPPASSVPSGYPCPAVTLGLWGALCWGTPWGRARCGQSSAWTRVSVPCS